MYALLEPGDSLRQKSFSVTIEGALAGLVSVMPGHELRNWSNEACVSGNIFNNSGENVASGHSYGHAAPWLYYC